MKYYLDINDMEFPNVSTLEIEEKYRNETKTYTLGGTLTVDRIGKTKISLTAKINMITPEQMKHLKEAVQLSTETVCKFYQGETLLEKRMKISDFSEPSPLYFYGDREQGMIYGYVEITAEEV